MKSVDISCKFFLWVNKLVFCSLLCMVFPLYANSQISMQELVNGDSRTWVLDSVKTTSGEHLQCDAQLTLISGNNVCYYRGDNFEVIKNPNYPEGRQISFKGTWILEERPEKVLTLEFTLADGYKKNQQTQIFIIRELTASTLVATTTITYGSTMEYKQYALFFRNIFTVPSFEPFFKDFTSAVVKNDTKKILSNISFPFYSYDLPFLCKLAKKKVKPEDQQNEFSEKEFSRYIPCLFTQNVKKQLQNFKPIRTENDNIDEDFFGVSFTYTFPFFRSKSSLLWFAFVYNDESKEWKLRMTDNISFEVDQE